MSTESPVPCSNCNKLLPPSTLPLHEAYCFRHMIKCPDCEEMVDKTDDFSHKKTHERAPCIHCQESFPSLELDTHATICPKKPKHCEFCKIPYSFSEFKPHQSQCGSRTRLCELCGKYIQMRVFADHEESCLLAMSLNESKMMSHQESLGFASNGFPNAKSNGFQNVKSNGFTQKNIPGNNIKNMNFEISSESGEEYLPDPEEKKSFKNDSKEYVTRQKITSGAPKDKNSKAKNEANERLRKQKKVTSYEENMSASDDEEINFHSKNKPQLKKVKEEQIRNSHKELDDLEYARRLQAEYYEEETLHRQPIKNNSRPTRPEVPKPREPRINAPANITPKKSYEDMFKRKK